jgi:lipopolysaccharide exporter
MSREGYPRSSTVRDVDVEPDGERHEVRAAALGRRVAGGFAWASAAYVGGRALTLVATAVLAHLLSPRDFGVVALALVFTAILDNFADLGVSQALVVLDDEEAERRASSAWTVSVLTGLGMAAVTVLCAPLVARFFDEPQVRSLLSVLGLTFAIRAVASTHYALAQRRLDFRSRSAAETAEVLLRGAVGCSLAVAGAGAWSLVLGYVAGTTAAVIVLWALVPFRPRPRVRRDELRGLLRFGSGLTAVDLLWAVVVNVDYLLIGRVLGAVPLGLYSLGFRLPELLVQNLAVVAGRVLYPTFAGLDRAAQGRAFLMSLRYTALVAVAVATGLAVLARPAVEALFGDAWLPAVPVMQVLCLHAVAVALAIPPGSVYKATGRAGIILRFSVPRTVLVVVGVAIFVSHGIVAVAWVQAIVNGVVDLVGILVACRVLGVPVTAAGRALWPSIVPALGMAVVLVGVEHAISAPWPALIVGTVVGAGVWAGLLAVVAPDVLLQLRALRRRGAIGAVA